MNTTSKQAKRRTNTGYKGISFTHNGRYWCYSATNSRTGKTKKFLITDSRSREQAFMRAMAYVRSIPI